MKGFRQLKWRDRVRLEELLKFHTNKSEIARIMQVSRVTIYNELKRGAYAHRNSDWTTTVCYSADLAQKKYEENLKVRGTQLKIGNDIKLANYIEQKIVENHYSPGALIGEMRRTGMFKEFNTSICEKTVYNYIDKGIFLSLTNKDLTVVLL